MLPPPVPGPADAPTDRRFAPRILLAAVSLLLLLSCGSLGFRLIEGWSWFDSLYMVVISITTVGYGEIQPLSAPGRMFAMVVILGGVGVGSYVLLTLTRFIFEGVVEGSLRRALARRRVSKEIETLSGHTIICGYGRLGQRLAKALRTAGRQVLVVEVDPGRRAQLDASGHLYLIGDAGDEGTLLAARLGEAASIAIATPSDAINTWVTLAARDLVPDILVLSRATDAQAAKRIRRAGADRTLSPLEEGGSRMASMLLRPDVVDFVDFAQLGDFEDVFIEQLEMSAGSALVGRSLREGAYGSTYGVTVLALKRPAGKLEFRPDPDTAIAAGDVLIVAGHRRDLGRVEAALGG